MEVIEIEKERDRVIALLVGHVRTICSGEMFEAHIACCAGFEKRAVQWAVARTIEGAGQKARQQILDGGAQNHEVWQVCDECGWLYDARLGGCC